MLLLDVNLLFALLNNKHCISIWHKKKNKYINKWGKHEYVVGYPKLRKGWLSCHSFHNSLVCVKQAKREASLLCLGRAQWDYCNVDEKCSVFNTVETAKNDFRYYKPRED